MEISEAVQFVREHHRGVLAVRRGEQEVQQSPVLAVADDAGRILVSTRETAMKTHNLRRRPRAWLCVFTDGFFGPWVQLAGTVEIVSLPEAMDLLVEYYRLGNGEHPDWEEYREAMVRERRCVVVLTPDEAGPTVSG